MALQTALTAIKAVVIIMLPVLRTRVIPARVRKALSLMEITAVMINLKAGNMAAMIPMPVRRNPIPGRNHVRAPIPTRDSADLVLRKLLKRDGAFSDLFQAVLPAPLNMLFKNRGDQTVISWVRRLAVPLSPDFVMAKVCFTPAMRAVIKCTGRDHL